jgi:hypothetical protein
MTIITDSDLWDFHRVENFIVIIPTNLATDNVGSAIMGAGLALQLKKRVPGVERELGKKIRINKEDGMYCIDEDRVRALPTKYAPSDKESSLELIERGLWWLKAEAGEWTEKNYILPKIGTGCGKLPWEMIEPMTEMLGENVWLVTR